MNSFILGLTNIQEIPISKQIISGLIKHDYNYFLVTYSRDYGGSYQFFILNNGTGRWDLQQSHTDPGNQRARLLQLVHIEGVLHLVLNVAYSDGDDGTVIYKFNPDYSGN